MVCDSSGSWQVFTFNERCDIRDGKPFFILILMISGSFVLMFFCGNVVSRWIGNFFKLCGTTTRSRKQPSEMASI